MTSPTVSPKSLNTAYLELLLDSFKRDTQAGQIKSFSWKLVDGEPFSTSTKIADHVAWLLEQDHIGGVAVRIPEHPEIYCSITPQDLSKALLITEFIAALKWSAIPHSNAPHAKHH